MLREHPSHALDQVRERWQGKSAVVLLSGGLDSSANLFLAYAAGMTCVALTIDYGQRAARAEVRTAKKLADHFQIPHEVVALPFLGEWSDSSLNRADKKPPVASEVSIDDLATSQKTAEKVWVYNRNGILIAVASALAEKLKLNGVLVGFNREEAVTFPDNRPEFIDASNHALAFSTANQVQVFCFTSELTKSEIVRVGRELKIPWNDLWPCYFDGETTCGICESCKRFTRAVNQES